MGLAGFTARRPGELLKLIAALARVKSYLDYGAFTPVQVAAAAALNGPQDCVDEQREISLFKDDIVEILDISKPEKWLVRTKYKHLTEVCYIPPDLLEPYDNADNETLVDKDIQSEKRPTRARKACNKHKESENNEQDEEKKQDLASLNDGKTGKRLSLASFTLLSSN